MPMLKTHLKAGVFLFPVYFFIFDLLHVEILNSWYEPSIKVLMISYVFFVLGSDLPDVDSPNAPIRWFVQSLVPIVLMYPMFKTELITKWLKGYLGSYSIPALVAISVVGGFALGYTLDLLKHRGFLHTNVFGLIYSGVCYLIARFVFDLSGSDLIFTTLAGFFGVWTHLLLDYKLSSIIRWSSRGS